jgi:hypothetical protein
MATTNYTIKKILVNENIYLSSSIVEIIPKTISKALNNMFEHAKKYVSDECGNQISHKMEIIDVHTFYQIDEPLIDTMIIYRIGSDSNRLHVYQRKTKIVPGFIYGYSSYSEFKRVAIFEIEESVGNLQQNETHLIAKASHKSQKTNNMMGNLIAELNKFHENKNINK